jgi:hypothetical protein
VNVALFGWVMILSLLITDNISSGLFIMLQNGMAIQMFLFTLGEIHEACLSFRWTTIRTEMQIS